MKSTLFLLATTVIAAANFVSALPLAGVDGLAPMPPFQSKPIYAAPEPGATGDPQQPPATGGGGDFLIYYHGQPQPDQVKYGDCVPYNKNGKVLNFAKFSTLSTCYGYQDETCKQSLTPPLLLPVVPKLNVVNFLDVGSKLATSYVCYDASNDPILQHLSDPSMFGKPEHLRDPGHMGQTGKVGGQTGPTEQTGPTDQTGPTEQTGSGQNGQAAPDRAGLAATVGQVAGTLKGWRK